jgi:4-aminobutyrate aminotransferase
VGRYLLQELNDQVAHLGVVAEVRGKGLMIGVELVEPGTLLGSRAAAKQVLEISRDQGLLIGLGGLHGNVLRIAPPMSVTIGEAADALEILTDALMSVERLST